MIGPNYWATGITLWFCTPYQAGPVSHRGAWSGSVEFLDDGFVDDDAATGHISTEGRLHTRYAVEAESSEAALTAVVDVLIRDAERLGITWQMKHLYYPSDGEDPDRVPPPGWRALLGAQCARIGWTNPYACLEASTS